MRVDGRLYLISWRFGLQRRSVSTLVRRFVRERQTVRVRIRVESSVLINVSVSEASEALFQDFLIVLGSRSVLRVFVDLRRVNCLVLRITRRAF